MSIRRRGTFYRFTVSGSISIGDMVAIDKSADDTVRRADSSDEDKMPAIGFVVGIGGGRVVITNTGQIPLTSPTITQGVQYFVSTLPGRVTSTPPNSGILQQVGIGRKNNKLMIFLETDVIYL